MSDETGKEGRRVALGLHDPPIKRMIEAMTGKEGYRVLGCQSQAQLEEAARNHAITRYIMDINYQDHGQITPAVRIRDILLHRTDRIVDGRLRVRLLAISGDYNLVRQAIHACLDDRASGFYVEEKPVANAKIKAFLAD